MSEIMSVNIEVENIRVFVRIRPLNESEIEMGCQKITFVDDEEEQIVIKRPGSETDLCKRYTFDSILSEAYSQMDVYYRSSHAVIDKVLQGYNGTIFAYGQTGTGKTFTMCGTRDTNLKGIVPNTFAHIFNHISESKLEYTYLVHVTYLEIYNENVRDLLAQTSKSTANLEVREHKDLGVFVKNLSGYVVNNLEELERLLEIGGKNRVFGSTKMNTSSSRSHTIFTITIESNNKFAREGKFTRGKLHLVDLAGSERQKKSLASGLRLKEATKINQSLSVLGNVISALADGKNDHIPYRNSKLTRLLQDSLGGNSKTVMITTISPSENDYEETISSLRYANRVKCIKNRTFVNEHATDTLLRSFQNEIEELRHQLASLAVENLESPQETEVKLKHHNKKSSGKKSASNIVTEQDLLDEINLMDVTEKMLTAKKESQKLREKLQQLKDKVLIGGKKDQESKEYNDNLLKCAQSKIDNSIKRQEEMKKCLKQCEEERSLIAQKYSSAQKKLAINTKELKRLSSCVNIAKSELAQLHQEQKEEIETSLESLKELSRESQLNELLISTYIPATYLDLINQNIARNPETEEYHLKFVAYTGNNLQKYSSQLQSKSITNDKLVYQRNPYRQYNKLKCRKQNQPHEDISFKLPNIFHQVKF